MASYVDAQFIEHEIEIVRTADENAHVRLDRTITARVVWELECHIGALFGVVQSAEAAVSVEPMLEQWEHWVCSLVTSGNQFC